MNTLKIIIMGTMVGSVLSILSLGFAYAGVLLLTGAMIVPTVLVISTLANGAILGTVGVSLSYLTTGLERFGLILLISLAAASVTIMLGSYSNGSLLPVGIYTMAILNSLLISPVTAVLIRRTGSIEETYVRG